MKRGRTLFVFSLGCASATVEGYERSPAQRVPFFKRRRLPLIPAQEQVSIVQIHNSPKVFKAPGSFKTIADWYLQKCSESPLITKSISAAIINLFGDVLAQNYEALLAGRYFFLQWKRMITFFFCGLFYVGPFVHYWYDALFHLGHWLERQHKVSKMKIVLAQVMTDQTLGVALYFPSYFYMFEILESIVLGRAPSFQRATRKCLGQLNEVLLMQYRIFPITNAFNLAYIPPELRVLFSNTVSIFWNMYLCTLLAR